MREFSPPEGLYVLLMRLRTQGGCIVRFDSLTPGEQVAARTLDRVYTDKDGFAYVWRPVAPPAPSG